MPKSFIYSVREMTDEITALQQFDDASLDTAFATLGEEVRATASESAATDPEAFRLHWLGRKQGRLKLISEAWLKSAPPEAKKALGIRFNQLKQQIEAVLESPASAASSSQPTVQGIDTTPPATPRAPPSSPLETPAGAATASSCAPIPRPSRSAP